VLIAQLVLSLQPHVRQFYSRLDSVCISVPASYRADLRFSDQIDAAAVSFFDAKMIGDLKQSMKITHRIETFLTSSSLISSSLW
jgi:hypothetical protein